MNFPAFLYKQVWLTISYYDLDNNKVTKSFESQSELGEYIQEVSDDPVKYNIKRE